MIKPIKDNDDFVLITSPYGMRTLNRVTKFHRGVDLKSYNFLKSKLCPIVSMCDSEVLRVGRDNLGNGFIVVTPFFLDSKEYMIKYIHVNLSDDLKQKIKTNEKPIILHEGEHIGFSEIAGNSKAHHLHLEVWPSANYHINPVGFFDLYGIKYKSSLLKRRK